MEISTVQPPTHMKNHRSTLTTLSLVVLSLFLARPTALHAQSAPACAQDVIVQSGDTLSLIASRTLNDLGAYQRIINATNSRAATDSSYARITDANAIAVGWKLCIPASEASVEPSVGSNEETSEETSEETPIPVLGGGYALDNRTVDGIIGELPTISLRVDPAGIHPLTIAYLRKQNYPGSPLLLEQNLQPGSNYNRYIVSYLSEGLKINALLTLPTGQRPASGWPVIIFNHGYIPPAEYSTIERYEAYVDAFAANGYIVLRPDLRGHGVSEGVANGAYGHPDYTIDVLNAVASIKQFSESDPTRIGMWGHSMGGYLALRAMVVSPDIKAGVIWSGVVASYEDLLRLWEVGAEVGLIPESVYRWGNELLSAFGTPESNPLFWSSISANSYVADLSGPIQLHHGGGDLVVPLTFSNLLLEDIAAVDGAVEYYMYPNDDHSLTASFSTAMTRSLAFFDTYVKNSP